MNYSSILEHAFHVTARHRSLWVLGFLWALVGGCGGSPSGTSTYTFGGEGGNNWDSGQAMPDAVRQFGDSLAAVSPGQWLAVVLGLCCLTLVLIVLTTVARYVLQAGVFRSLDQLDAFGVEPTVRDGWREGWHRRTWRPFLQDLLVGLAMAAVIVVGFVPALIPLGIALIAQGEMTDAGPLWAAGGVSAACYCCLWIVAVFVIASAIGVLRELWWRYALLEDRDFLGAIADAWRLGRANARPLLGMWLVMFLVGLLWVLIVIGLAIGFGLLTALVAGGPAWLVYRATESPAWPFVWGIPAVIVTFVVPMLLAGGLYLVFQASVWTQVFRALAGGPSAGLPVAVPAAPVAPRGPEWSEPVLT